MYRMLNSLMDDDLDIDVGPRPLLVHRSMHPVHRHKHIGRHGMSAWPPIGKILADLARHLSDETVSNVATADDNENDRDKFRVMLDVQQFRPNEITVKVVDNCVVVEGSHEEKEDEHGWISRKFVRRYLVPEEWDISQVMSKLSSDGVLSIVAPRKDKPNDEGERVIPIQRTGKPALQTQNVPPQSLAQQKEKVENGSQ